MGATEEVPVPPEPAARALPPGKTTHTVSRTDRVTIWKIILYFVLMYIAFMAIWLVMPRW